MNQPLAAGLDCADRTLRAVMIDEGHATMVPLPWQDAESLLFFAPRIESSLGVGFPSVLQSVGMHTANFEKGRSPDELVTQRLRRVRESFSVLAAASPVQAVLTVPTALGAVRRSALLQCAAAAGFESAQLMDQCPAAALAYHACIGRSATILVLQIGYASAEHALIRIAKGQCRVIATGELPGLSGQALDAAVMEAVVLALRKQRLILGLKEWTHQHWNEFRKRAEEARGRLLAQQEAILTLLPALTRLDRTYRVRLHGRALLDHLAPVVQEFSTLVQTQLEQNDLSAGDVDALLLVGAEAQSALMGGHLTRALPGPPVHPEAHLTAAGAALHAHQHLPQHAADSPVHLPPLLVAETVAPITDQASRNQTVSAALAELIEEPGLTAPPRDGTNAAPSGSTLDAVRALLTEGKLEAARTLLTQLTSEVEQLHQELTRIEQSPARRLLCQSRTLLEAGRLTDAVTVSHQAYDLDRTDPTVFEEMMRIHADAAVRMGRAEEYTVAIKLLLCAHGHDQTDRSIHQALAERHFRHAMAMLRLNNPTQALEAVRHTLTFDPRHTEATELFKKLATETP